MPKVMFLLIAFFPGPTNTLGDVYIFENPLFPEREFCEQYVKENKNQFNIYLSIQYQTMPQIYESEFYCLTKEEFKKKYNKSKEEISV